MFQKTKKSPRKIILNRATIYIFHKDSERLDIYPNCMLFQKENNGEYYVRGLVKIIGPDNIAIIGKKQGEVFETETNILLWLPENDDTKAYLAIKSYINSKIDDCMSMLEQCRELNDAFKNTFGKDVNQNRTYNDNVLKNIVTRYVYRTPRMRS